MPSKAYSSGTLLGEINVEKYALMIGSNAVLKIKNMLACGHFEKTLATSPKHRGLNLSEVQTTTVKLVYR